MSWEHDRKEYPCFCETGKRITTYSSDDWGRSETREFFECPECTAKYILVPRRNREDRGYHWVLRAEWEKHQAEIARRQSEQDAAVAAAREQYGSRLVEAFSHIRARKALYEHLRGIGFTGSIMSYFSWFNAAVRTHGRDQAVRMLFEWKNLPLIRKVLGIEE